MIKITARIRKAKGKGLWLFIDREGDIKNNAEDIANVLGVGTRDEDEAGRVAYAIVPEEVIAIRDACNEYLEANR